MAFLRRDSPWNPKTITIGGADRGGHLFKSTIIGNSAVMKIGDVVTVANQAAGNGRVMVRYAAVGDKIVGICRGFGRANGQVVSFDSGTNDTVTVAADNETVAQIYAIIDVTPHTVFSAPLSATIHTTAIFGAGSFVDPDTGTNAGRILESSVTAIDAQETERGLACLGPDPVDTTRGLVMIVEGLHTGANADS